MKNCPNCGLENQDETNFCIKCGSAIRQQQTVKPEKPAKKTFLSSKAFLAVVALILVGFIINATIVAASPSRRLLKGLERMGKMDAFTVTSLITLEYDGDDEEMELMNDASIKTTYAMNLDKMLMELSMDLLFDNKSIAKGIGGLGEKELYIDLQKLYDKTFSYTLDREARQVLSEFQILLKYIRKADIKFDVKKYAGIIAEVMDDDMKGSLGKVTLSLDDRLLTECMIAVMEEMADDDKLMESIRKNAEEVIKGILKDKHQFELFDEDDLEDVLEVIEDEDLFEIAYLSIIEEGVYSLESMLEAIKYGFMYMAELPEIDITFTFGMFQDIKDIKVSMVFENPADDDESMTLAVDSRIKRAASFTKVNTKKAVDIEDLIYDYDYDELQDISEEIFENLADNIKKNRKLSRTIEDLAGVDVEDLADLFFDYLFY